MNSEIHLNEPFGYEIFQTIIKYNLARNLEIGSWDGEGSTKCIVSAMKVLDLPNMHLTCIEVVKEKYDILKERYRDTDFVQCENLSSISFADFIPRSFDDVWDSKFNKIPYPKDLVKTWFDRDMDTLRTRTSYLKSLSNIPFFDSVLIDGSEFTGYSEFKLLKNRTNLFFLDDVHHAYKCNQVYHELKESNEWIILSDRPDVRNGFAIFQKRNN